MSVPSNAQSSIVGLRTAVKDKYQEVLKGDLTITAELTNKDGSMTKLVETLAMPVHSEWCENSIRYLSMDFTLKVIQNQIALDNYPEQILFDNSPTLHPSKQMRTIDVIFDMGTNIRQVMNALAAEASKIIPGMTWGWKATAGPLSDQSELSASLPGNGPVRINHGDRIYMIPQSWSGQVDPTYGNILWMRGKTADARGKVKSGRAKRPIGWFGLVSRNVKRMARGSGVHLKAVHSFRYAQPFRKLPPGVNIGQGLPKPRGSDGPPGYQGTWAFSLSLMRGGRLVNRR